MTENLPLAYDGFHKIAIIETEIKGRKVLREKLLVRDSVGALVTDAIYRVGLVKQFRPTTGEYLWEIPAGVMDKQHLTHLETILEELEEECEITKDQLITVYEEPIEEYYMMAGSSDAKMLIYHITVTEQQDKQVQDVDVEEVKWFTREQLVDMIKKNEIKDSKTKLALHYFISNVRLG